MWYMNDYSYMMNQTGQLFGAVLRLFSDTLAAVTSVPAFVVFIACAAFGVAYGLWLRLSRAAGSGGRR